jgi:hypothetical protein
MEHVYEHLFKIVLVQAGESRRAGNHAGREMVRRDWCRANGVGEE